jgi:hypothetical protein
VKSKLLNRKSELDFSTLSGIMERFRQVSYDQFQMELNDWFYKNLSRNDSNIDIDDFPDFPKEIKKLANKIFQSAESLEAKQLIRGENDKVQS